MAERQLKIKVGTLRRYVISMIVTFKALLTYLYSVKKDLEYYAKEHTAQKAKIAKMRDENKDEYDIKKQEEVLVETETMLPDCQMRLKEASNDLTKFLSDNKDEIVSLTTALEEAQQLLGEVKALLQ